MNIAKLAAGIPVVIIGALLLIEGLLAYAADTTIWLGDTNQAALTIAVALIALLLGGSLLEDSRH